MLDFGYYNMDCMEGLRLFPDKYFDLAIVDPPYGIGANKFRNGTGLRDHSNKDSTAVRIEKLRNSENINMTNARWDLTPPSSEYFDELFRVSKNWVIWGANYFKLPPSRGIIVWDKMQPWDNFSQVELAYTSFDCPASIFRYRNTNDKNKIHPTQKPIELYTWLLNKFSKSGDVILDTHVGSASSLIATYRKGLNFVGFELDKFYYELSKERLSSEMCKKKLF